MSDGRARDVMRRPVQVTNSGVVARGRMERDAMTCGIRDFVLARRVLREAGAGSRNFVDEGNIGLTASAKFFA